MRRRKVKGPKKVSYELIDPKSETGKAIYAMVRGLIREHRDELADAKVAIAWNKSWRPDKHGFRIVSKLVRASDLDRELAPFDLILLVLKPLWDALTNDIERRRLLFRALCHGCLTLDERTQEPVYDERGRKQYGLRKAPIQEFPEVIQLFGFDPANANLQALAREAVLRAQSEIWQPCEDCRDSPDGPGWVVKIADGVKRSARCDCWTAFRSRRAEAMAS